MPTAAAAAASRAVADDIPQSVKSFVTGLYHSTRDGDITGTHELYEDDFPRLSVRLYRDAPWPPAKAVAPYCNEDRVFLLLYSELTFRHAHARLPGLNLTQPAESWDNYRSLFAVVLQNFTMKLPNQWLWDMVDGFVNQFQRFCQFRTKLEDKTEDEINLLERFNQAWNYYGVVNNLRALVNKSTIREILKREVGLEQFTMMNEYDYRDGGESNVLKMLGYYSMIGLLKVYCLIGDYHTGLKCLSPIDISQQGFYTTVTGSLISTIYYYGFANFMMHRYADAIRQFNRILLYILKYKKYHQKSPQYDLLLKKNDKMYALLAICLSLCPLNSLVDENVCIELNRKYGTEMEHMLKCDGDKYYDELFSFACPKFIAVCRPVLEEPFTNYNQDVYRLQLKLFLAEVKQQQLFGGIRSLLKLFSVITISKLAQHMEVDETTLMTILLAYKRKTHAVDNYGEITSSADIDFYIDMEMETIHATEQCRSFWLNVGRAGISNYPPHLFSWPSFSIGIPYLPPYFQLGWADQGPVWPQRNSAPATESKSSKHQEDYFLTPQRSSQDYSVKTYILFGQAKAISSCTHSFQARQLRQSRVRVSRELEKQAEELTRKCLLQYDAFDMTRYLQSSVSIPCFLPRKLGWMGQGPVWHQHNSAPATESKSSSQDSLKKYISFGQTKTIYSRAHSLQARQFRVCRAGVPSKLEKQAENLTRTCLLQYNSMDTIRDHMGILLEYLQSSQILISQEQKKLFQLKDLLSEPLGLCSQVDQIKELFDEDISKLKKSCKEIGLALKALTDALHVNFNGDPLFEKVNDIRKRNIKCSNSAATVVLKYHDHMEREQIELSWFIEPANEVERLTRLLSDYSSKSIELEKSFSQKNKEIISLSEVRPAEFNARYKALKKWANMWADVSQLSRQIVPFAEAVDDQYMYSIDLSTLLVQKASYCKRFIDAQEYFRSAIPKLKEKLEELWNDINQAQESYMEKMGGELPEIMDVERNYESTEHIIRSWRTRLFQNRNIMAPFRFQGKEMCTYVSTIAMTESLNKREHAYNLQYVGISHRHSHFTTKLSEYHLQDIVRDYFSNNTIQVSHKLQVCFEKMKKTGVVSEEAYDLGLKDGCHRHKISTFEKLEPLQVDKAFAILDSAKVLVGTFSITPGYFSLKPDDIYDVSKDDKPILSASGKDQGHAVVIVGYGKSPEGQSFYVYQNSYGKTWGKGGFGLVSCRSIRKLYTANL